MGGFGKSGFLKILIKIRVPGPKSAHFLRPPARRPWLPTVALLASRPQRPQDAHAPGAALQAGNARPWPMAGYIHPRHHCAVASLVHRLFSSRVDALESQVQFCWQEAHGERHEASHIGAARRSVVSPSNGSPKSDQLGLGGKKNGKKKKAPTHKKMCLTPRPGNPKTGCSNQPAPAHAAMHLCAALPGVAHHGHLRRAVQPGQRNTGQVVAELKVVTSNKLCEPIL